MVDYVLGCLNTSCRNTFRASPLFLTTAAAVETGTAAGALATLTHHDTVAGASLTSDAPPATASGTSFVVIVFARAIAGAALV